jgi:hypothetical protein
MDVKVVSGINTGAEEKTDKGTEEGKEVDVVGASLYPWPYSTSASSEAYPCWPVCLNLQHVFAPRRPAPGRCTAGPKSADTKAVRESVKKGVEGDEEGEGMEKRRNG